VEAYLRQLQWYDSILRADAYVLGAAIFQLGIPGWEAFDLAGPMAERLADYGASQLSVPDGAPSTPDPSPMPARGHPREQYARTYVLLPPNASPTLALAAARSFFGPRYTIGYSADDAGIGDLDRRTVIAVDAEQWGSDLLAWFAQNYPGVNFQTLHSRELT
jgi:hypothetical protein